MKTSRNAQFVVAVTLVSIGCVLLLTSAPSGFAMISFYFASFSLFQPSALSRSVPPREVWISAGFLASGAAFIILANYFIPQSTIEYFVRQPMIVALVWLAALAALFWRWSREKGLDDN